MVTLPAAAYISDNARTQGERKQFLEDVLAFLTERFGLDSGILARSKNALINGNFDLWQRGSTVTTTTGGAYIADRWRHELVGATGSITVSRQAFTLGQTDVPGEPQYYYRADQTAQPATGTTAAEQRIEGVRSFAGQKITVSFHAKADAAQSFEVEAAQNFGSGGSPSAEAALAQNISATTGWALYSVTFDLASISGKTLGNNGDDYLGIRINATTGTNATFTLDVASFQVEPGEGATPFDARPLSEELILAQRYYEKSFDFDTDPDVPTTIGSAGYVVPVGGGGVGEQSISIWFRATKRRAPTLAYFSPSAGGTDGDFWNGTDSADSGPAALRLGSENFICLENTQIAADGTGDVVSIHWTADAEL